MISFPKTLDNTTVSAWAKCPRAAFYAHFMHLAPKAPSIHLHAGGAYATALETFRSAFYNVSSPTHHDKDASLTIALRALFLAYGYDEERDALWESSPKSAYRIAHALVRHFEAFPPRTDSVQPLSIDGEAAVEKSFSLELELNHPDTGLPILFHGRFDMLAEYENAVWVFDDKTCSQLGKTWTSQWDWRSQFTGYIYGARSFGFDIMGAIVRGACLRAKAIEFSQSISQRSAFQLEQWWEDLHHLVHEMISYYNMRRNDERPQIEERSSFPQRGTFNEACSAYGGCSFQPLCSSANPQRWLSQYKVRVWDPTNPSD